MFLWLPRLLRDVTGAEGFTLSAITALPFVAALVAMVVVGRHSDRTGERRLHVAVCAAVTALGLLLVAVASQPYPWILVLGFTIAQMALRSLAAVFWAMPPQLLGGRSAAAGIALDQLDRRPRRLRRPDHHRRAARRDGRLHGRPARPDRQR